MLDKGGTLDAQDTFTTGKIILLSILRAAASRHIISATMTHLIVSSNGTRFTDSHDFGNLLDSQLEATFEGNLIDVHISTFKLNGDSYL